MSEKKKSPLGCCWLVLFVIALVVSVTLFTLRITGQIDASYWLVFSPLILVIGVPTVILSVMMIVVALGKRGEDVDE